MINIEFILHDINNGNNDPFELQFRVLNEDEKNSFLLKKDFNFQLTNKWTVSANNNKAFLARGFQWYIKGSIDHVDGRKKYYRQDIETSFYKPVFNEELRSKFSDIEIKIYKGTFDYKKKLMIINKEKKV